MAHLLLLLLLLLLWHCHVRLIEVIAEVARSVSIDLGRLLPGRGLQIAVVSALEIPELEVCLVCAEQLAMAASCSAEEVASSVQSGFHRCLVAGGCRHCNCDAAMKGLHAGPWELHTEQSVLLSPLTEAYWQRRPNR